MFHFIVDVGAVVLSFLAGTAFGILLFMLGWLKIAPKEQQK